MVEVDPIKKNEDNYLRAKAIIELQDIDTGRYAEVHLNGIHIISKNTGK